MTLLEGVDVSYMQGDYTPGGEDFVIVNASRANIGLTVGSCYRTQVGNARAAGAHVGHYFFNGNADPTVCADFFIANLAYEVGDSLWLDIEAEPSTGTAAWTPAQALTFLDQVKARVGVVPGVYLNRSLMDGADWSAVVAVGALLWIASYNPEPPPIRWWPVWTVWQYTPTPIDRNKAQTSLITAFTTPTPLEDDTMISTIRDGDGSGSIYTISPDLTLDGLTSDDYNAGTLAGVLKPYVQAPDGLAVQILARRTMRLRAAGHGDPTALAQATAALVIPAVLTALQGTGATGLTPEQVQAACEDAIKRVFAHAAR